MRLILKQVHPIGIHFIYKVDFLLTRTCFDLFLSKDGILDVFKGFVINQLCGMITRGEFPSFTGAVFLYAAIEVIGNTCVEDGVGQIGEDVDIIFSHY